MTTVAASVHPGRLIGGLVSAAERRGVNLYEDSPVLRFDATPPLALYTPTGRVEARDVVFATNAYTPRLGVARELIAAIHLQVLVTRPLTEAEWETSGLGRWPFRFEVGDHYTHTVRATPDRRFFFRHALGHRAFEEPSWPNRRRADELGRREMIRRYPWLADVPIAYPWHGVIAQTRDWWPIGGQVDEHCCIAAGFNGSGIMTAHYFGYLLAHLMTGADHEDAAMLRPPGTHPQFPTELFRHLAFQGWFRYQARRDGRRADTTSRSWTLAPRGIARPLVGASNDQDEGSRDVIRRTGMSEAGQEVR